MNDQMIDIDSMLNHKLFYDYDTCYEEDYGILGMGIKDERYLFEKKVVRMRDVDFLVHGELSRYDNIICNGQEIAIHNNGYSRMVFLGFNEFGNYEDVFRLIDISKNIIERKVFFNGFTQVIEGLYECELDSRCTVADTLLANGYISVNIYISEIEISRDIIKLILPVNPELHILAISLC